MSRGERWGKQCAPKPTPSAAQPQLSVCVCGGTAPHRPMLAPPLPAACASGAALAIQGGHKNGKQLLTARRLGSILLLLPPPPPPPQMRASIHRLSQTARRVGRRASGVGRTLSQTASRTGAASKQTCTGAMGGSGGGGVDVRRSMSGLFCVWGAKKSSGRGRGAANRWHYGCTNARARRLPAGASST